MYSAKTKNVLSEVNEPIRIRVAHQFYDSLGEVTRVENLHAALQSSGKDELI